MDILNIYHNNIERDNLESSSSLPAAAANNDTNHYFINDQHFDKVVHKRPNTSSVQDSSYIRPCYSMHLCFASRQKNRHIFKSEWTAFCNSSMDIVLEWVHEIRLQLEKLCSRPKRLLVFLNPYGGRKKGREIYEKRVKPLFDIAEIDCDLIITQRANHAHDHILDDGWGNVDGIVCIGGDGTVSEIVNAVLMRTAQEKSVNMNDFNVKVPNLDIPIGIIPAGSTDTIIYSLHGTADIETAVIHVIEGDILKSDLGSVHSENKYIASFVSIMSYGILGDVIKNSIDLRWMGPFRYDCAGARNFICHKSYEGTVEFERSNVPVSASGVCLRNDCSCTEDVNYSECELTDVNAWQPIRGKFFMVTAANISCCCDRTPNGLAPHCHFSDGYLNLLLIRRITFTEKMKLLFTLSNSNRAKLVSNLEFVEIYKTKRFRFETGYGSGIIPATKISSWNIDGELMDKTHLEISCHRQRILFFCRRVTQSH